MPEDKTYAQRIAEAERAVEMLEALPWEAVGQTITRDWAKEADSAKRDSLWYELQAVARLRSRLAQTIQDGRAAAQAQEQANKPSPAIQRAHRREEYANKLGVDLNG